MSGFTWPTAALGDAPGPAVLAEHPAPKGKGTEKPKGSKPAEKPAAPGE